MRSFRAGAVLIAAAVLVAGCSAAASDEPAVAEQVAAETASPEASGAAGTGSSLADLPRDGENEFIEALVGGSGDPLSPSDAQKSRSGAASANRGQSRLGELPSESEDTTTLAEPRTEALADGQPAPAGAASPSEPSPEALAVPSSPSSARTAAPAPSVAPSQQATQAPAPARAPATQAPAPSTQAPAPAPATQAPAPAPAAPAPAPTTQAPAPAAPAPSKSAASGAAIVSVTNDHRAAAGLGSLTRNGTLDSYAQSHAEWMASTGNFQHQDLGPVLRAAGASSVAENIADTGSSDAGTIVGLWMDSPGHRANILTGEFNSIGVGSAVSASGRVYTVQLFGTI